MRHLGSIERTLSLKLLRNLGIIERTLKGEAFIIEKKKTTQIFEELKVSSRSRQ